VKFGAHAVWMKLDQDFHFRIDDCIHKKEIT